MATSPVGQLLRQWRERRRMSQLALAVEAEVSSRHVSFVETGRGHPSREMVLLLAGVLDVPPRAGNDLLTAAGYAPIYHPQGLRPYIVNWEVTAAALIQWLHRDLLRGGDTEIRRLLEELLAYPDVPRNWRTLDLDAPPAPFLAIEVHKDDTRLRLFTTLTSLGTPYDITLHELRIESFFPADDATDTALRRLSAAS